MANISREQTQSDAEQPLSRLWRYAPLVFWLAAIFLASTDQLSSSHTTLVLEPFLRWLFPRITSQRIDLVHLLVRKIGHFCEYAILAFFAARAFRTSRHSLLRIRWFWASLVLIAFYALSDEYHQSFVPSRTASIYDSLIDIAGGLTVLLVIALWKRRKQSRAIRQSPPVRVSKIGK